MTKKQQRFYKANFEVVLSPLKGQKISLILKEKQVFQVVIKAVEKDRLVATDGLNRVHYFPLVQIEEVIVEKHA